MARFAINELTDPLLPLLFFVVVLAIVVIVILPGVRGGIDVIQTMIDIKSAAEDTAKDANEATSGWEDAINDILGLGEIKDSWFACNGPCGEVAQVIEVCNRAKGDLVWSDEIAIAATVQNLGETGTFNVRIRPPTGDSHILLPCGGAMCSTLEWKRMVTDETWTAEYSTARDTRAYKHFKDGYVIQLRKQGFSGSDTTIANMDDNQNLVDAIGVTEEMIPAPGEGEICTTFER